MPQASVGKSPPLTRQLDALGFRSPSTVSDRLKSFTYMAGHLLWPCHLTPTCSSVSSTKSLRTFWKKQCLFQSLPLHPAGKKGFPLEGYGAAEPTRDPGQIQCLVGHMHCDLAGNRMPHTTGTNMWVIPANRTNQQAS